MANSVCWTESEQSFNTNRAFQLKTLPPASSNQINSVALFAFFNKQNSFKCEQNFTLLSHVFFFNVISVFLKWITCHQKGS